jgi:hypothetical protein
MEFPSGMNLSLRVGFQFTHNLNLAQFYAILPARANWAIAKRAGKWYQ